MEDNTIITTVEQLKSKGNESYQEKRFKEAIGYYTEAIEIISNIDHSSGDKSVDGIDRVNDVNNRMEELDGHHDDHDDDNDDISDALVDEGNYNIKIHNSIISTADNSCSTNDNDNDSQSKDDLRDILSKCLMNRSICHSQLKQYDLSNIDAKNVLLQLTNIIHKKYNNKNKNRNNSNNNRHKAYYRLIKNSFDTKSYRDTRFYLSQAILNCGEHKDFKLFEEDLITHTGKLNGTFKTQHHLYTLSFKTQHHLHIYLQNPISPLYIII